MSTQRSTRPISWISTPGFRYLISLLLALIGLKWRLSPTAGTENGTLRVRDLPIPAIPAERPHLPSLCILAEIADDSNFEFGTFTNQAILKTGEALQAVLEQVQWDHRSQVRIFVGLNVLLHNNKGAQASIKQWNDVKSGREISKRMEALKFKPEFVPLYGLHDRKLAIMNYMTRVAYERTLCNHFLVLPTIAYSEINQRFSDQDIFGPVINKVQTITSYDFCTTLCSAMVFESGPTLISRHHLTLFRGYIFPLDDLSLKRQWLLEIYSVLHLNIQMVQGPNFVQCDQECQQHAKDAAKKSIQFMTDYVTAETSAQLAACHCPDRGA